MPSPTACTPGSIWIDRNNGVGVVTKEEAIAWGYTGPSLRGSGVEYDVRVFEPYLVYDQLDFTVPMRSEGDSLARYFVRVEEMEQSISLIRQCLQKLPAGPVRTWNLTRIPTRGQDRARS